MTVGRDRIARTLREGVLTIGAVLGVVAIIIALGAVVFGLRPLIFRSGSMSPTIGTGDLALAHRVAADDLRVGDVVSVPTQSGDRVTHRIVKVQHQDGGLALLNLRGDANRVDDAQTYPVTHADRVLFSVPKLGYAVAWVSGPTGRFALGIYAAFLLMVIFRRRPAAPDGDPDDGVGRAESVVPATILGQRGSAGVGTIGTALVVSLGLVGGGVAVARITPTVAAWTDGGGVTGTNFAGYTVPAPVLTSCTIGTSGANRTATFNWSGVTSPATTYTGTVSTITTVSAAVGGTAASRTYVVTFATSPASGNRNKNANVTISPSLTATPSWTGPADVGTISISSSGTPTCAA